MARKNPVRQLERVLIGRIRAVAEERGMPMSHLAARAEISRSSLWEVMNGRASPTLDWVQRIAEVLEIDPLALLAGEPVRLVRRRSTPSAGGARSRPLPTATRPKPG